MDVSGPVGALVKAVKAAQDELAKYAAPGERDAAQTVENLLGVLDHEEVVEAMRTLGVRYWNEEEVVADGATE